MQYRTDIVPIGGMNTDDDPRHFQQGDYLEARNVKVSSPQDQGDQGLVQNIKSTAMLVLPMIDDDQNYEHLGFALDEENDCVYILSLVEESNTATDYFVIYKHDITDNSKKIIFAQQASIWGISRWPIRAMLSYINPRIVDSRLIWTDNDNDIRQMDVVKMETTYDAGITTAVDIWNVAVAYFGYGAGQFCYYLDKVYEVLQSTYHMTTVPPDAPAYYDPIANVVDVYLDPLDPSNFTLAALPPLIAPTVQYMPTPQIAVNQLKGKIWQFSYQYVYMDYRKSTFAPPSLVPAPSQEETIDGAPETDPTHNNTIRLQINTGNEQVRSIRVVARTSEDPSTWFVVDEIFVVNDKDQRVLGAGQLLYVYFYNDKAGDVVPSADVFNLFHYVPVRAKHMELIEGNRLAFAHITEGYSRVGSLVDIDLSWEDLGGVAFQSVYLNSIISAQWDYEDWFYFQLRLTLPSTNPGACDFKLGIRQSGETSVTTITYSYNGTDPYPATPKTGIQNAINAQWPGEVATCFYPNDYYICAFERYGQIGNRPHEDWMYDFYYEKTIITHVDKSTQLKTGATHAWAIVYRDLVGRITPLIGAEELTKYIPFPTESTDSNVGRKPIVTFEINHLPPPQAASYEIVYAGNKSTSWHLQLMAYNFAMAKKDHTDPSGWSTPWNDYYRIRIKKCQDNTRDNLLNWSVEEYVWEKGDRIRIIGKVDSNGTLTEINDAIYDVEIMAVFDDTEYENTIGDGSTATETIDQWIYFPVNTNILFLPSVGSQPNVFPDNLLVEIYRPFRTESNLYFTTGMTFAIGTDVYGNKYHKGNVNQVLDSGGNPSTPASVVNTAHDCWKYLRNFRNVENDENFAEWIESQYVSDFYVTEKLTSQGQPIPNIDSQQQNVLTKRARHGGQVSIGSQLNFIAEFEYDDYVDLKDEHGPIEGLRLVGFVLKVVQYNKTTSIYISRQESFSASGDPQYLFTDKVFGSVRPEMENYGTSHPQSVMVHNRHLYFWDQSEGCVIRDSANGQIAISDAKMKRHFSDLAKTMEAEAKVDQRVLFTYDKENDRLMCVFGTETQFKEIYTFSEQDQRWKEIIDLIQTFGQFYWIGKRLWHLHQQYSFEWWKGTGYQSVSNQAIQGKIIFYASADPAKPATYESIIAYQKGARPQFGLIEIPAKATAAEDGAMATNIYDVNIKEREGVYYCQILRDRNTPYPDQGPLHSTIMELKGRKLRGLYIKIEMQITEQTDPVSLSNIIVLSTGSERSK